MALTACSSARDPIYQTPRLNDADRAHLTCGDYPEIRDALRELPPHVFLSGANGQPVVVDGQRYVRFDVVNNREALIIRFGEIDGRTAHHECKTDLEWLGKVWTELEATP